jgi:predicted phage baseplate assembly protein
MTALAPLSLDDLTFEDLRLMALRRIPAASGGRWTHHAPVDPGVTLLELFAFLLEQQLFVLDQVPDALTHAILALLGEAPRGTGVASTVVGLKPRTLASARTLPAGTEIRPAAAAVPGLIFSTVGATRLLPVDGQEVFADGVAVTDRLERGEAVPVMARDNAPGSLAAEVRLREAIAAGDVGRSVGLAVVLEGSGVAPEWHADAAEAPAPGPLSLAWSVPGASGLLDDWHDGTGGLRRSGLVTFALPAGTAGADRLRLTLATDAVRHAQPPRIKALALGAAVARHSRSVEIADHDTGDAAHDRLRADLLAALARLLPISGQMLDLPSDLSPVIEDALSLRLADAGGAFHDWVRVPDLGPAAPEDRAFTFDRSLGRLAFGDGYAGRVPAPATNLALSARLGGGPNGNHAAGVSWRTRDHAAGSFELASLAPAEGGAEPETLALARARVAGALAARHRAVTAEDFVELAENAPVIGPHRAHVIAGHDPAFPCLHIADTVTVFVVPRTEATTPAPRADDGAIAVIARRLDAARMLTTRVFVRRPAYRPVELAIEVATEVGAPGPLGDSLRPILSEYLHPALGGPAGTGWPFGRPLRPSELLRVAEAALPAGARIERVAIRLGDTAAPEEDCTEVVIAPSDLVRLERLVVRVRHNAAVEATL